MIPKTFAKADVYEGTVQWRQYHRTIPASPFNKRLLTLPASEIYFPKYLCNIVIKGDLSIGEHCFSESIILVEGSVRCYPKSFISQISIKKDFQAIQGNISIMFLEAHGNIHLGARCNIGIAKSFADITIGRNSIVQSLIGNNITIYKDTIVGSVYAKGIVRIPKGFPEERIITCKRIEYL